MQNNKKKLNKNTIEQPTDHLIPCGVDKQKQNT